MTEREGFTQASTITMPEESIGFCVRTLATPEFYMAPRRLPLIINYFNDLTKKELKDYKRSYKPKLKKVKFFTYTSHSERVTVLGNGYCEDCWDIGLGGQLPSNTYNQKIYRKKRRQNNERL